MRRHRARRWLLRILACLVVAALAVACLPSVVVYDGTQGTGVYRTIDVSDAGIGLQDFLTELTESFSGDGAPDIVEQFEQNEQYEQYDLDSYDPDAEPSSDVFDVDVSVTYGQSEARTMLDMVNDFRTGDDAWYWNSDDSTKTVCTGLSELTYDYDLERIAMQRAAEIALSFSHTRPNGESWATTYQDFGYMFRAAGENIAAGYLTASDTFEGWQETDEDYVGQDHRRNMLSSDFGSIGIGHAYYNGIHFWVQEFAQSPTSSEETPASEDAADVSVGVLGSYVTSLSCEPSPTSCDLAIGEHASLPVVTGKIQLAESWPSFDKPVDVPCAWATSDDSAVSVSEGEMVAQGIGSAELTCSVMDQTLSVPVTVQFSSGVIDP